MALSLLVVPFCLLSRARRRPSFARRWKVDAGSSRLRKSDSDCLLRRCRTVFSFSNMVHFLANELTCLRAGGFSFAGVILCAFERLFLRHTIRFSLICSNNAVLVSEQINLVEPNAIRLLFPVAVHLEGYVNLLLRPVGLGRVIGINVVLLVRHI
jgi:hypothetical protein